MCDLYAAYGLNIITFDSFELVYNSFIEIENRVKWF